MRISTGHLISSLALLSLRKVLAISASSGLLAFLVVALWPVKFEASTALLLNGSGQSEGLLSLPQFSDIAPYLGLSGAAAGANGYTYAQVVRSRALLSHLLSATDSLNVQRSLLDSFAGNSGTQAQRENEAYRRLARAISTRYDNRSEVFEISVRNRDPELARRICASLVLELRRFDSEVRSTQARAAVEFLNGRLEEARRSLIEAEGRLVAFHSANARIGNAPQLLVEEKRLERSTRLNEELYLLLAKQLEVTRIQERKELPVFSVMDPPVLPTERPGFSAPFAAIIASIVAFLTLIMARIGARVANSN